MKKRFLVVHDYGTGGAWAYVRAESADTITSNFPALTIVPETPEWLHGKEGDLPEEDVDHPGEWLDTFGQRR